MNNIRDDLDRQIHQNVKWIRFVDTNIVPYNVLTPKWWRWRFFALLHSPIIYGFSGISLIYLYVIIWLGFNLGYNGLYLAWESEWALIYCYITRLIFTKFWDLINSFINSIGIDAQMICVIPMCRPCTIWII